MGMTSGKTVMLPVPDDQAEKDKPVKHAAALTAALALSSPVQAEDRPSVAPRNMQAMAPGLADYTDRILFGDVWEREALSPRDRSLVTLSVLVATGKTAQLGGHLGRGLSNGLKPTEISGLVTHLAFYTGWPNAVSAVNVIEEVFAARNIDASALRTVPGVLAPLPASEPARAVAVRETMAPVAPKLAQLTNDVLFADLWRRTDLSPRDRSLVTIAALAANGDSGQLAFHIRRGLENGLTKGDVGEAFTHLAFYAGWPKASAAVSVARELFEEAEEKQSASSLRLDVLPAGQSPVAGPAANFTGSVMVASAFKGTGGARLGGATVTFQPGAHTNWHSHPLGQLLIVTNGHGWVQAEGESVRAMAAGDTIWIGPNVRHWHGATRASAMTHVAASEALDGKSVTWFEPVTDAQYRGPDG